MGHLLPSQRLPPAPAPPPAPPTGPICADPSIVHHGCELKIFYVFSHPRAGARALEHYEFFSHDNLLHDLVRGGLGRGTRLAN
ncbi:hypothetical protein EVAR_46054_1 [Eumeta japonica]|uniref:Uncharacterized protein n=1 Tax=Eumeta variegata TaxID=151549 RepID=A0A4C2ABQ8_EUMVA|nr:hypothetical protein EVAR_46054_1 [Eumeta japonica]